MDNQDRGHEHIANAIGWGTVAIIISKLERLRARARSTIIEPLASHTR